MKIRIRRKWFTNRSSVGTGTIDGDDFNFFTVEDVARAAGVKIPKETAIPAGTYRVIMDQSERHQSIQPHILNVPLFSGIRFDVANFAEQVEGCIAVGAGKGTDAVWNSKQTHKILCEKIQAALDHGELVWVEITNEQEN